MSEVPSQTYTSTASQAGAWSLMCASGKSNQ
ncbi:Uncharacterised protein [Bordetella pertussis]|nr:Uncharacterised protein [Bordetella pertussis]